MATQSEVNLSTRKLRPGKFVWFEHVSRDARRAQKFFAELFDWRVVPWSDPAYEMIATGDTKDSMIGGYDAPKSDRQSPHWISYVSVEDVDAAAKAASKNGGRVVEPPYDLPGVGRAARIADPQGAEVSLFKNDAGDPDDPLGSEAPSPGRFFWNELHTTHPEDAVSFYEKVLGFTHKTLSRSGRRLPHTVQRGSGPRRRDGPSRRCGTALAAVCRGRRRRHDDGPRAEPWRQDPHPSGRYSQHRPFRRSGGSDRGGARDHEGAATGGETSSLIGLLIPRPRESVEGCCRTAFRSPLMHGTPGWWRCPSPVVGSRRLQWNSVECCPSCAYTSLHRVSFELRSNPPPNPPSSACRNPA